MYGKYNIHRRTEKNNAEIGIVYEWKQSGCDPPPWEGLIIQSEAVATVQAYVHDWEKIRIIDGLMYRKYPDTDEVPSGLKVLVPLKLHGIFCSEPKLDLQAHVRGGNCKEISMTSQTIVTEKIKPSSGSNTLLLNEGRNDIRRQRKENKMRNKQLRVPTTSHALRVVKCSVLLATFQSTRRHTQKKRTNVPAVKNPSLRDLLSSAISRTYSMHEFRKTAYYFTVVEK